MDIFVVGYDESHSRQRNMLNRLPSSMITVSVLLLWLCCRQAVSYHAPVFNRQPCSSRIIRDLCQYCRAKATTNDEELTAPSPQLEQISSSSKPPLIMTDADMLRALGTSPRRILVSTLSATGIALAANFLGLTSAILGQVPESIVERTGLDMYYPRAGFKRYNSILYTFLIPQEWVADTALELQKAQQRVKPLTYSMRSGRFSHSVLPDVAFGLPGRVTSGRDISSADTNVSVIVSDVLPGFSLDGTLGTPEQAADYLLKGMKRDISLIEARLDDQRNVYELEYQVNRKPEAESLRCISVIGFSAPTNTLITLTVVAPATQWANSNHDDASKLRKVASSFRLKREPSS